MRKNTMRAVRALLDTSLPHVGPTVLIDTSDTLTPANFASASVIWSFGLGGSFGTVTVTVLADVDTVNFDLASTRRTAAWTRAWSGFVTRSTENVPDVLTPLNDTSIRFLPVAAASASSTSSTGS